MCILIDNIRIVDISLVEKVLRRLQGQNMTMLKAFLQHAIMLPNIETINNLPIYYSRVVDGELNDIGLYFLFLCSVTCLELDNNANAPKIRSLIFFLLSCPTEGRHHFNVINQRLAPLNAPLLSALVTLSASPIAVSFVTCNQMKLFPLEDTG